MFRYSLRLFSFTIFISSFFPAPVAALDEYEVFARSKELGLEAKRLKREGEWCRLKVEVLVNARDARFYRSKQARPAFKKIVELLVKKCPKMNSVEIRGTGEKSLIWKGELTKASNWQPGKLGGDFKLPKQPVRQAIKKPRPELERELRRLDSDIEALDLAILHLRYGAVREVKEEGGEIILSSKRFGTWHSKDGFLLECKGVQKPPACFDGPFETAFLSADEDNSLYLLCIKRTTDSWLPFQFKSTKSRDRDKVKAQISKLAHCPCWKYEMEKSNWSKAEINAATEGYRKNPFRHDPKWAYNKHRKFFRMFQKCR